MDKAALRVATQAIASSVTRRTTPLAISAFGAQGMARSVVGTRGFPSCRRQTRVSTPGSAPAARPTSASGKVPVASARTLGRSDADDDLYRRGTARRAGIALALRWAVYGLGAIRSQNAQLCCAETSAAVTTSVSPAAWRDISSGSAELNRGQAGAPVGSGTPVRAKVVT